MGAIGKQLVIVGALIVLIGVILIVVERAPWLKIGRLPGDFLIERGNWRFYFPLATSILLSIILTLIMWLFRRR
ncbi:MAG TPA: DUF2905 domain-containing protein [Blastocatellia bacterium]|nr:DUF2905 domain-containing protein [Blastocatellia bacterium]